tara:strand:+ start:4568 stop:16276 length:11709 start_codon:yes stop_codon:yes gene_type:complete
MAKVLTAHYISPESFEKCMEELPGRPGVPFYRFRPPGQSVDKQYYEPTYGTYEWIPFKANAIQTSPTLEGEPLPVKWYLKEGALAVFVSKVFIKGLPGDPNENEISLTEGVENFVMVRLLHGVSAIAETVYDQDTDAEIVVQPTIDPNGKAEDVFGLIDVRHYDSIVMDPTSETSEIDYTGDTGDEDLRPKLPDTTINITAKEVKDSNFWWLPKSYNIFRSREFFSRDGLIKKGVPAADVNWDKNTNYSIKIIDSYGFKDDGIESCNKSNEIKCPLVLAARLPTDLNTNKAAVWRDKNSTLGENILGQGRADYGYILRSNLMLLMGGSPEKVFKSAPPAAAQNTTILPSESDIDRQDVSWFNKTKCKYYVKLTTAYDASISGYASFLENSGLGGASDPKLSDVDKYFNLEIRLGAFRSLLQENNKVGASTLDAWINEDSDEVGLNKDARKALYVAFEKTQIELKQVSQSLMGKIECIVAVPSSEFDKIPSKPTTTSYALRGSDYQFITRFHLEKKGVSLKEVLERDSIPQGAITSFRPTIDDIFELGQFFANEVQTHYINEFKEHITLVNIDFNLEASNLTKFSSALRVLFAENEVDIESLSSDAYVEVGFNSSFLPTIVLYDKGDGTGTYKFNKGMQNFKNFASNKRTNQLIFDIATDKLVGAEGLGGEFGRNKEIIKKIHMLRKTINENRGREQTSGVSSVNQAYANLFKALVPSPKTKAKTRSTSTTPSEPAKRPKPLSRGRKSHSQVREENGSIAATIKNQRDKRKTGSLFSKETNKAVADLVKTKSHFNLILDSRNFFGKKGVYEQVMKNTNLNVYLKDLLECAGIDLKGDDLFEVICNQVLQALPMEDIKKEVLDGLDEASGEVQDFVKKSIDDLYEDISSEDFDPNKFMNGLGKVLQNADFNYDPLLKQDEELAAALGAAGKKAVNTGDPRSSNPTGGVSSLTGLACGEETLSGNIPGQIIPGVKPSSTNVEKKNVPYLMENSSQVPGSLSSGDAVYIWKVYLNFRFSQIQAGNPNIANLIFTDEDFKKYKTKFTEKTAKATVEYTNLLNPDDELGKKGIVSKKAYEAASVWWAASSGGNVAKYQSDLNAAAAFESAANRVKKDNIKEILNKAVAKSTSANVIELLAGQQLAIRYQKSFKSIDFQTTAVTHLVTLSLEPAGTASSETNTEVLVGEILTSSDDPESSQKSETKAKQLTDEITNSTFVALKELGLDAAAAPVVNFASSAPPTTIKSSTMVGKISTANASPGPQKINHKGPLSDVKVPQNWAEAKGQLDGLIRNGAFDQEGQKQLLMGMVEAYKEDLAKFVGKHLTPEYLCGRLESYIMDFMVALKDPGAALEAGLGMLLPDFKGIKLDGILQGIGHLWLAAVMKAIDQSLLEMSKWAVRYIQLNCELAMAEASEALAKEIAKIDSGFLKGMAEFGAGLVNMNKPLPPEQAVNVVLEVDAVTTSPTEEITVGPDLYKVQKGSQQDLTKTNIMTTYTAQFLGLIRNQDMAKKIFISDEEYESAGYDGSNNIPPQTINSLMAQLLMSLKAKELILLFRGDASPELLKNVLIFIEERYPGVNVLIDTVGAVASLFGFIGEHIDLDLLIGSLTVKTAIEDACELEEYDRDLNILSSQAALALEEENRKKKKVVEKTVQLMMENGLVSKTITPVKPPVTDFMDFNPHTSFSMRLVRDTILDFITTNYRNDVRKLRSALFDFNMQMGEPGSIPEAGSFGGKKPSELYQEFLDSMPNLFSGDTSDSSIKFNIDYDVFPELKSVLRGDDPERQTYNLAYNDNETTEKADFISNTDQGSNFKNFYNKFMVKAEHVNGEIKRNTKFAYGLLIDDFVPSNPEVDPPIGASHNFLLLDPPGSMPSFAGYTSEAEAYNQQYHVAVIKNNNTAFYWSMGPLEDPTEFSDSFLQSIENIYTFGDPCNLKDEVVPHSVREETTYIPLPDDFYPDLKDPLMGNITGSFPMDISSLNLPSKGAPAQAKMFARYVTAMMSKNMSSNKKGVYVSESENSLKNIEDVKIALQSYVFPRFSLSIIQSYGEYLSRSKYFKTTELFKITKSICDPRKTAFDLLKIDDIKDYIARRWAQINRKMVQKAIDDAWDTPANKGKGESDPLGGIDPLTEAMLEAVVKLTFRTFLAEILIRGMWIFDRFKFEEVLGSGMFLNLFSAQIEKSIGGLIPGRDPKVFKNLFMRECRSLVDFYWSSASFGPASEDKDKLSTLEKNAIRNNDKKLIKYLASVEIREVGADMNKIFARDADLMKDVKEIFFDSLNYGFIRNDGSIFVGTDGINNYNVPRSAALVDYDPNIELSIENQYDKLGDTPTENPVIEIDNMSNQQFADGSKLIMNGNFMIEPYIRLVDIEKPPKDRGKNFDTFSDTAFDQYFGPNSEMSTGYNGAFNSYTRPLKYRGILAIRDLENLANDLKQTIMSNETEALPDKNPLNFTLSTFYKEIKYGVRLSMVLPTSGDDGFDKLEEIFNKLIDDADLGNQFVPQIHKAYRVYKEFIVKDAEGNKGFKKPLYVLPLTFKEVDAKEGSGANINEFAGISVASDLYNKTWDELATVHPKNHFLKISRRVEYPSDADIVRIKYNMGYRDPAYENFQDELGTVVPLPIYPGKDQFGLDSGGSVEGHIFKNAEDLGYQVNFASKDDGVEKGGKGIVDAQKKLNGASLYQIERNAEYALQGEWYHGGDNEGHEDYQTTFADRHHISRAKAAYNHLLVTQFARNEFAQWMGVGVELDEETHYVAEFAQYRTPSSLERPSALDAGGAYNPKAGYHPEIYAGLIGRPDFNVQFDADWGVQGEESYPHGPADDLGCKKFTSADYNELGFGQYGENQLSSYSTADYSPEGTFGGDAAKMTDEYGNLVDVEQKTDMEYNNILVADFNKNMAAFKMTRCRKSPRYDQPGADYPGGKEAVGQVIDGPEQDVYMMPSKYNISEVFPPHKYEFTSVPTLDGGDYLSKVIEPYVKSVILKNSEDAGEIIGDYYEKLCGEREGAAIWDSDSPEYRKWMECKNSIIYKDNSFVRNAAQETEYKHPGGMPIVVQRKRLVDLYKVDEHSHVFSGIYSDIMWNDWRNSSVYKKAQSYIKEQFEDTEADVTVWALPAQFSFNGYDQIQTSKFNYAPVEDNIPVQIHQEKIYGKTKSIIVGSPAMDYLSFNPKITEINFKGSVGPHNSYLPANKPYVTNASSLEASQIWVKNADSIDFRELANKKTDYILQRLGFMQPFWTGRSNTVTYAAGNAVIAGGETKSIPIFDKNLVVDTTTFLDKKLARDDDGKLKYPEKPWDIEGEVDIIPEGGDQFNPDTDFLLVDDLKTPARFKKYPRSRIDTWSLSISHHSDNVWKTPTVEDLYDEGVLVRRPDQWIRNQDGITAVKENKYNLVLDDNMILSKEDVAGRKINPKSWFKGEVVDTDQVVQDLVGEDIFVGIFPDKESIENIREIFAEIANDESSNANGFGKHFGGLNQFHELGGDGFADKGGNVEMFKIEIKGLGEINGPAEKGSIGDGFGDIISKYFAGPSTHWKQTQYGANEGAPPYYPTSETLSNPLSVNSGLGTALGPDNTLKSSAWLQKMINHGGMPVEDIVANPFYYAFGSDSPGDVKSTKYLSHDELPADLKKYYNKGVNGFPAIKMTVTSGNSSRVIQLYQVAVRAPELMKLGNNFDFGAKFEVVSEPSVPDDPSIWFDEFFMGTGETSIYGHLRREMLDSQEFKLLFNYVFPLREFASTVSMYVLFYGFYNDNSFLNKISSRLFSNTKSSLMSVFDILSSGGDPYREYYPSSEITAAMQSLKNENVASNGLADSNEAMTAQEGIAAQIKDEGMVPGFLSTAGSFDLDGDGLTNIRVLMEIIAGFCDPGFDFFPITPFGWAALMLRQMEKDKLNEEEDKPDVQFEAPPYSNPDADLCDTE